mgnify:CR=1 FL=1
MHSIKKKKKQKKQNKNKTKQKNSSPRNKSTFSIQTILEETFYFHQAKQMMGEVKGKEISFNPLPHLNLVDVNNMVAVYTKKRQKKQTNKQNIRLARMARLTQKNLCIFDQPDIFESDRSKSFSARSIFEDQRLCNQALLSGLGPKLLALLDSCLQHRCSHQAEWSGQNIPRRLLGSHVHLRPQTMDGPGSVEKLKKE